MIVFVYRNLRTGTWSVRDVSSGRVIDHPRHVRLKNAEFKVSIAGRKRVLREKRKNVHAGVLGELLPLEPIGVMKAGVGMHYNPYEVDRFIPVVPEFRLVYYVRRGQICAYSDFAILNLDAKFPSLALWEK